MPRRFAGVMAIAAAAAVSTAQASEGLGAPNAEQAATCAATDMFAPAAPRPDLSRLILGGAPSALDRIRMSQAGLAPSEEAVSTATRAIERARMDFEPASRTPITLAPAPPPSTDCNQALPRLGLGAGASQFVAMSADRDSELGTRAIAIKRTRFDDRWDRVRRPPPAHLMRQQLSHANATGRIDEAELLARVNAWVNREITYRGDDQNYRRSDFWATAQQTLALRSGDCEDFAILKMHMLRAAGIDPARMKLVLLRDLAANADHAFLLVQTDSGKFVLDNTTDRVYDGSQAVAVRPVLSFSENRRWVHAYRGEQPFPTLVSTPASQQPVTLTALDQRSVRADPLTFRTGLSK